MTSPATARRLWALAEPFHALTYFADEARAPFAAAGLRGFWAATSPAGPVPDMAKCGIERPIRC